MSRCSACHRYYRFCKCTHHFESDKNNYGYYRKHGLFIGIKDENKYYNYPKNKTLKKKHCAPKNEFECNHSNDVNYTKLSCKRKNKGKIPNFNYFVNTHGLISDHCLCLRQHTKDHIHNRKCCYQNSATYYSGIVDYQNSTLECSPNVHCKHYYR